MQAGFAIASNNLVGQILQVQFNLPDSQSILFNTMLTSAVIVGMVLGSFLSGWLIECGRRTTLIAMSLLILVSTSTSLIFSFYAILTAKFFQGFASACIVNTCEIYIVETCPPNRLGLFGSLVNLGIVAGLSVYFLQGVFIPNNPAEYATTQVWRYIYAFPIPFAVANLVLFLWAFEFESLQFLIKRNKLEQARRFISRLYITESDYQPN